MDLHKQLDTWIRQNKWDKVIRTIEKIKPKGRTDELNSILATAYLMVAKGWEDRKTSKKALDILRSFGDVAEEDSAWYLLVAKALQLLERYSEATQYLQIARDYSTKDEFRQVCSKLEKESRKLIGPTAFTEPFSERVAKVWEMFVKRETEFRNILDKDFEGKRAGELQRKVTDIFENALNDPIAFVCKYEEKYLLGFSGGNDLLRLFEELYMKVCAPASVLEKWEIRIGVDSLLQSKSKIENESDDLKNLQLWFQKVDYGLLDVEGYSPALWKPTSKEIEKVVNNTFLKGYLVMQAGEAVVTKYLDMVGVLNKPRETKPVLFSEVTEFYASEGIDIHAGTQAILEKMVPYIGTSQDLDNEWEYREDVINGASMAAKTIYDEQNDLDQLFFNLEADGALICSFYFDNESFEEENREENVLKYRQSVEKELLEKAGAEAVKIIGYAHGKHWEYIDMIAWNPKKVFEVSKTIAEVSPAKTVIFHILGPFKVDQCLKGNFPEERMANFEIEEGST